MRTINQIIEDAKQTLLRDRADRAEAAEVEAAETRRKNAEEWAPIVAGLKPFIPVELHECISFNADELPEYWHGVEYNSGPRRRPIRIVLPVPEQYTVFGYYYSDTTYGFSSGVLKYSDEHDEFYFTPTGERYGLSDHAVTQLDNFQMALGETIENYHPRKPKPAQTWSPPPTPEENLLDTLREFVRKEIQNCAEEGV